MIVSHFLLWTRGARPGDRAEAVGALARAFLYSELSPADRAEAETALTAMLDDPAPLVRRAIAENLASSERAPQHLMVALASDQSEIAAIVLASSPVLADCDLVDCAALGCERVQQAIASRPHLSASASGALAEIGTPDVLVRLAANPGAEIADLSLARIVERHGDNPLVREALLARPDLPVEVAQAVASALAEALGRFVTGCGWLSAERSGRVTREARERTAVALSSQTERNEAGRLVGHLRRSGQLTPALILRAILSRSLPFAEAAFAELTGMAPRRVSAILRDRRGAAFRALYDRAGMPPGLRPAFEAALSASREAKPRGDAEGARLSRRMVERALSACEALPTNEADRLMALLRRFQSEATRDDARRLADGLADQAAQALARNREADAVEPKIAGRLAA